MKKLALLLFAIPAFCSAQQNGNIPKPAVDDCPSWNKKSKSDSKAEYFYFLRTNKAKDQQLAANYPVSSQRTYPSTTIVRYAPEEDPFLIPKRARRTQQTAASPAVNNALKAPGAIHAAGSIKEEEEKSSESEEIKAPIKEEPVVAPIEKKEEKPAETKAETSGFGGKQPLKGISKREKRAKRHSNHSSAKKVKACKSGNASKCPSF